jgi:glycosyltransferase involved in cell wall biosynthesis
MHIVVHDFSGHPFQADLARRLAARGHTVLHLSSAEYVSGKGRLERQPGDPEGLTFDQISIGRAFNKYRPRDRVAWEREYGRAAAERTAQWPGVIIMCNVPLIANALFVRAARRGRQPWLFWHQDIYSAGIGDEIRRKFPSVAATPLTAAFDRLEGWVARHANAVVAIGDAFTTVYPRWRVDSTRVSVIPNWAPLEEIVPQERDNPVANRLYEGDPNSLRLLYAGTLGRKHNPLLLVELLREIRARGIDATLTVVSEGEAADDLAAAAANDPSLNLRILPFQPAEDLPFVLGGADILVGLLEPEATTFSIPSKVLTYMAAGRPILGLMPADNPAASDIRECGGYVGDPISAGAAGGADWVAEIAGQPEHRADIGKRTRSIAEERFDPDQITDRFEGVLAAIDRPTAS